MEATCDLQKQMYNITLTAVVWSAKTECQVQGAALQSCATRWLCTYNITPSHMFDCHIIYCGEIKDIGE